MFNSLCKTECEFNHIETIRLDACRKLRRSSYNLIRQNLKIPGIDQELTQNPKETELYFMIDSDIITLISHVRLILNLVEVTPLTLSQQIYETCKHVPYIECDLATHGFILQMKKPVTTESILEIFPNLDVSMIDFQFDNFNREFSKEIKIIAQC